MAAENHESAPQPIFGRCNDESNDGDFCDMQPGHGGLMHAGSDPLVWWSKETGERVDFRAS